MTRSEIRRDRGDENLNSNLLLYEYDTLSPIAYMNADLITTARTAAIAVQSAVLFTNNVSVISMVGLGKIGTMIGDILFDLIEHPIRVKVYKYKDQAEAFIKRYSEKKNLVFEIVESYDELMKDSDLIFSSVTYMEGDFCNADIYKSGCTIIPVHMRGFMECDKSFDHIITNDLESIKKFRYYDKMKKLSLSYDLMQNGNIREKVEDRVIVYNLGIAYYDIFFAKKIYDLMNA